MFEEREVTDFDEIDKLLSDARMCRVSVINGKYPYMIPMCYGYNLTGGKLELYFCRSDETDKTDLLKHDHNAAFEIDKLHEIARVNEGCGFRALYRHISGIGEIEFITGMDKIKGLNLIMKKYGENPAESKMSEQTLNSLAVFKLTALEFSCYTNVQ